MNVVTNKGRNVKKERLIEFAEFHRVEASGSGQRNDYNASNDEHSFSTLATHGYSAAQTSSTFVCIASGRGYAHGEVGIACIDVESPHLKLIQLSDDPWYSALMIKLHIIHPCEILLPSASYDAKPQTAEGKLVKFLREEFPKVKIAKVPRRYFNEAVGFDLVSKFCSDKYNYAKNAITGKYYALSAVCGLIKYLQIIHNIYFKENSLKLDFQTKYAHMQIDIDTVYKLELLSQVDASTVKGKYPSLYDVMNHCVTSIGKRTLRARILEPMCDIPSINEVHDCIEELGQDDYIELTPILSNVLRSFNNVERLHKLALVVPKDDNLRVAEVLIKQTLHLKRCLQLVPVLRDKLNTLQSKKLREIGENLMDERYQNLLNKIETVINPNLMDYQNDSSSQLFQRVNCIQRGVNELVDVLRVPYNELRTELEVTVAELSTKYGQAFKLHYTVHKGFHVQLKIPNSNVVRDFPPELESLHTKQNTCYLTTTDVNKLNIRIKKVIEEITLQTNVVIADMLSNVVTEIDAIYDLSGFVATLDIILSLTEVSKNVGYVCPSFGEEMRIVDGIHPLLEHDIHKTVASPNNIIATPEYNFFIITGPNMSGKTVYIKMIAILQVMAQVGCYVPAQSAQFRITDRLFTRIGFNDSIEKNASTFVMEMNTMEYILQNVTPNSLVIIDELCRSTNPAEGAQLAWNLSEYLCSVRGIFSDGKYFMKDNVAESEVVTADDGSSDAKANETDKRTESSRTSNWKNSKLSKITAPFVFLTSHYHVLTKLADYHFNVVNLSFCAEEIENQDQRSLKYDHRIREGVTQTTSYGLALARTVRFPRLLLNRANEIHQELTSGENPSQELKSRKPKLSNVCKELLKNIPDSRLRFERPESVVSVAIENYKRPNHRKHMMPTMSGFGTCTVGKTTQSIDEDEHLALDRILYNAYGDIASLVRKIQVVHEMNGARIGDKESDAIVRNAQNVAIKEFLFNFVNQQPDALVEALSTIKLSSETDKQSISVEQNNEAPEQKSSPSTLSRVSETPHEMSSNISNQNRQIVERYLSQSASPTIIMANNMVERDCAMPGNCDVIQGTVKSSTNYEDWADDDFEDSLALIPDVSPKNRSHQVQCNERTTNGHSPAKLPLNGYNRLNECIADDFRDAFNSNATGMTVMAADSQAYSNFTQRNDDDWSGTPEQFSPFIFTQSESEYQASPINEKYQASPDSTFGLGAFESFGSYEREFGEMFEETPKTTSVQARKRPHSPDSSIVSSDSKTMTSGSSKVSMRPTLAPVKSKLKVPTVFGSVSQLFPEKTNDKRSNTVPGISNVHNEKSDGFIENISVEDYNAARNRIKMFMNKPNRTGNSTQIQVTKRPANNLTQANDDVSNKACNESSEEVIPPPLEFM